MPGPHEIWNEACKVYIGNLGESTSEQDLDLLFSGYGPVKNVWISPRKHQRYGFVEYEDAYAEDAHLAVHDLNGKLLGDNCVRVQMLTPSECRLPDPYDDNGYLGGGHIEDGFDSWIYRSDRVAAYSVQGLRETMEDRFVIHENFNNTGVSLFAIFDGHKGEFAVEYASKHLINSLKEMITEVKTLAKGENGTPTEEHTPTKEQNDTPVTKENGTKNRESSQSSSKSRLSIEELKSYLDDNNMINLKKIFQEEIPRIDKLLTRAAKDAKCPSGTTALIAVIEENQLTVANVGDSRGVMCDGQGNVVPLSFDHKPQNKLERRRITKAGGIITRNKETNIYRVKGLAMSRALGNYKLKDLNVIIAKPDVTSINLANHKPRYIILASDGLWDKFTNGEAVGYVAEWMNQNDPNFGAKNITLEALRRASRDNITVIVINLSKQD